MKQSPPNSRFIFAHPDQVIVGTGSAASKATNTLSGNPNESALLDAGSGAQRRLAQSKRTANLARIEPALREFVLQQAAGGKPDLTIVHAAVEMAQADGKTVPHAAIRSIVREVRGLRPRGRPPKIK